MNALKLSVFVSLIIIQMNLASFSVLVHYSLTFEALGRNVSHSWTHQSHWDPLFIQTIDGVTSLIFLFLASKLRNERLMLVTAQFSGKFFDQFWGFNSIVQTPESKKRDEKANMKIADGGVLFSIIRHRWPKARIMFSKTLRSCFC